MSDIVIETGKIREILGDIAVVEIEPSEACENCGARIVCAPSANGMHTLNVYNNKHAKVGDVVEVKEPENLLLKISAIQYGLPLFGFVFFIFIFYFTGIHISGIRPELTLFLAGLLGLLISFFVSRFLAKNIAANQSNFLFISKIISR